MRIVSGSARGRKLLSPPGSTRPTTDRVREALFNTLDNLLNWENSTVLDLYAGSGAVGLEAASRGARAVTLVEKNAAAAACAEQNRQLVGVAGVSIVRGSVQSFLAVPPGTGTQSLRADTLPPGPIHPLAPYDLVFADPPYAQVEREWPSIMETLLENEWVADGSIIVLERSSRDAPTCWPKHVYSYRSKKYGETRIDIAIVENTGNLAA